MCENCGCSEANTEQTIAEKVQDSIEAIRESLKSHGGDVELVGIDPDNAAHG